MNSSMINDIVNIIITKSISTLHSFNAFPHDIMIISYVYFYFRYSDLSDGSDLDE